VRACVFDWVYFSFSDKYIGTNCELSLHTDLCCPCDIFIEHSECVDKTGEYLCYCKSGYMSDDRGITCTKRKSELSN